NRKHRAMPPNTGPRALASIMLPIKRLFGGLYRKWVQARQDRLDSPFGLRCARPHEIAYCIFKRREREEKRFYAGDFEHFRHSLACAGEHYASSHLLTRNMGRDECSQSG